MNTIVEVDPFEIYEFSRGGLVEWYLYANTSAKNLVLTDELYYQLEDMAERILGTR